MVATAYGTEPDSPLRDHRPWMHAEGKRIHGTLAKLSGLDNFHAGVCLAECLAIPQAA